MHASSQPEEVNVWVHYLFIFLMYLCTINCSQLTQLVHINLRRIIILNAKKFKTGKLE